MALPFELACGSIVGRAHVGMGNLLVGKACQDAIGFAHADDCLVVCVHDGCSASQYAEVGARTGSEIVANCILNAARQGNLPLTGDPAQVAAAWEHVRSQILRRMFILVEAISGAHLHSDPRFAKTVRKFMQFTTLGAIVTANDTAIFSIGDGVWAVNGEVESIPPYPGNAPPYLCYDLLEGFQQMAPLLRFHLRKVIPTGDLQSLLIGTDGVSELIAKQNQLIPGKSRTVGPLEQLWQSDQFFAPDFFDEGGVLIETLTPWLRSINSEVVKLRNGVINRQPGLVQDDVALVVLRRRKE
jgi:hypothetical protein